LSKTALLFLKLETSYNAQGEVNVKKEKSMTWYPYVSEVRDNGFGGSRNGQPINGVVIHHVAGTNGLSYVANANTRNSHPTYHIARSGAVTGIVNPSRRPHSTGGAPDPNAVAFEIDNSSTGGDWPITPAALEALIDVIVFHASQSPRAGRGFAKNQPSVAQSEFFIAWHSQYKATACPGPFIMSQLDYIVAECNKRAAGVLTPAPAPVNPAPAPITSKPALSGSLRIGSTGDSVRYLQSVLGIKADGQFGPITDRAVKAFQSANGLKVDGIVGPITWGRLGNPAPAPAAPVPAPPAPPTKKPKLSKWLKVGSKGVDVAYLQRALGIKPDGIFGPITDRKVKEFQRSQGLKVDGIVGPITWARLG
jgi:peptidoglycan hydrolase-like protein with peptidoglycan-binding domain